MHGAILIATNLKKINLINVGFPYTDDVTYRDKFFRTIEASIILCHELNHALQYQKYYPTCTNEAINIASFDILESEFDEFFPEVAANIYYRNPCELQSELFAIKYVNHFLNIVRPDISNKTINKTKLDYVNQRLEKNHGRWFFPMAENGQYTSLDEFVAIAENKYDESFHMKFFPRYITNPDISRYVKNLNSLGHTNIYEILAQENDGQTIADTYADIIYDVDPTLKKRYFETDNIEFKHSILPYVKKRILLFQAGINMIQENDSTLDMPDNSFEF